MKFAIHDSQNSFSERWINYCKKIELPYKIVNCYSNDIMDHLKDCDGLLWHHNHNRYKDLLFAKQLLFSLEQSGKSVFPEFNSGWHFDDKVGQKYLFEALELPVIPTHVFYDQVSAKKWITDSEFPKVFKLRGGAGSSNVKLIKTRASAKRIVKKAFGRGFPQYNGWDFFIDILGKFKEGKVSANRLLKAFARIFIMPKFSRIIGREKGYVYFQDFIPKNDFDIRVIVIDSKMFAIKRMTRKNDFRASGSGTVYYNPEEIPEACLFVAKDASQKLNASCLGFDFVFDENGQPLIVEVGYGFAVKVYDDCPGYWDFDLNWTEGKFIPQEWMVDALLKKVQE